MTRRELTSATENVKWNKEALEFGSNAEWSESEESADETSEEEALPEIYTKPEYDLRWQRAYNTCVDEVRVRSEAPVPSRVVALQKEAVHDELFRARDRVQRGTFCLRCLGWVDTYAKWRAHNSHSSSKSS